MAAPRAVSGLEAPSTSFRRRRGTWRLRSSATSTRASFPRSCTLLPSARRNDCHSAWHSSFLIPHSRKVVVVPSNLLLLRLAEFLRQRKGAIVEDAVTVCREEGHARGDAAQKDS